MPSLEKGVEYGQTERQNPEGLARATQNEVLASLNMQIEHLEHSRDEAQREVEYWTIRRDTVVDTLDELYAARKIITQRNTQVPSTPYPTNTLSDQKHF